MTAFREGLAALGWIEGRNLRIDYRWGADHRDRQRTYAAELVITKQPSTSKQQRRLG